MSTSASNGFDDEMLPLIPCPECGGQVVTWIAQGGDNAGDRFYKCARKDAGLCGYIRSNRTYRPDLNRYFGVQHYPTSSARRQAAQLGNRVRSQQAADQVTAGLGEAHSAPLQMQNTHPTPATCGNQSRCCSEMQRLVVFLAGANLVAALIGLGLQLLILGRLVG